MRSPIIFAYITCKNKSEAKNIGKILLKERLAACINIFDDMNSLYWWKGEIVEGNEAVLIAKTSSALFGKLSKKVKSVHSYSIPCILQIPIIGGNKGYLDWLKSALNP